MLLSDGKKFKDVNRLRNEYIIQVLTIIDIIEIVKMGGKICNFYERTLYKKTSRSHIFKS